MECPATYSTLGAARRLGLSLRLSLSLSLARVSKRSLRLRRRTQKPYEDEIVVDLKPNGCWAVDILLACLPTRLPVMLLAPPQTLLLVLLVLVLVLLLLQLLILIPSNWNGLDNC